MLKELVLKELREHLLSLRFQVGFLLAFILVSASAFVLSTQYQHERQEFFHRLRQEDEFLGKYSHLNRLMAVVQLSRPPAPVVLVRGLGTDAGIGTLNSNSMIKLFPPMDVSSIVGVIFSLLGIVLGFDAINGEKERGTLRMMLANRLPRYKLVMAKWLGGMLVLVVALSAALLAAALIVQVRAGTHWSGDDWLALVSVWGLSLLHTGAFFSLGLASSAMSARSSVSVLTSLFAWVVLVFVVPNISPYVAAQVVRVPPMAALQRDIQYLTSEERDQLGRAGAEKVMEKYRMKMDLGDIASEKTKRRVASDPEFRQIYEQYRKEIEDVWTEVNRKQEEKADRLREAWRSRADRQFQLSKELSYASPLPPFTYAVTELTLTGFKSRQQFQQQAGAYQGTLWEYVWARYHEEQKKNPALSVNDFLDVSARPRFTYVPPRSSERLAEALPFAGVLAAWNIILFGATVVAFLRFDVR